ncbi:hypothetical protein QAD02_007587 [Eretmocerus hayati]|uniref:Uncharacterized protein n=1 Tax=Eretmocerus hayati TaxID=131215 RepID=A0ACC2N8G1_9HYME|nr:hypothetical protein QAD02_007587 [Eretmocerus hayati]
MTIANIYITLSQDRRKDIQGKRGILTRLRCIKSGEESRENVQSNSDKSSDKRQENVRSNSDHLRAVDGEMEPTDWSDNVTQNEGSQDEIVDQFDSIHNLACLKEYENIKRELDDDEFRWIYILPEQLNLYRDLTKMDGLLY